MLCSLRVSVVAYWRGAHCPGLVSDPAYDGAPDRGRPRPAGEGGVR